MILQFVYFFCVTEGKGATAAMEACASYVAMLQSRRADEEASRASRSQRRANTVALNNEIYKRRANGIRRRAMDDKLQMTSQKETEMFNELSALSKWRHVMYENIAHRERQHEEAEHLQSELHANHLENVRRHEEEQFNDAVRDDKERFDAALKATVERKVRNTLNACRGVVEDVLQAVEQHIDFMHCHDLCGKQAVPAVLSGAFARKAAFPSNPDALMKSLVSRHVSMSLYADEVGGTVEQEQIHSKLFLSLVHKVLHLQFPKPPPFKPKNPGPQPIIAVVGPKLSGKSTIATAVAESLGMVCFSDVQLIQLALTEFGRDLTEADWTSVSGTELLDLGRECQESLLNGQPISVDLLARLILYQLRHLASDCNGIILDGTPGTVEGFERLEQTLSGYDKTRMTTIPDELLAPLLDDVNVDDHIFNVEKVDTLANEQTQMIAKKDGKAAKPKGKGKDADEEPLPPVDLPVVEPIPPLSEEEEEALMAVERDADMSSIHAVVHLESTAEELFKRFAGLRVDQETGRVYHLTADPPPADRLPFLVARDRSEASTAKIHKMVEQHLEEWAECAEWLNRYEGLVYSLDANKPRNELVVALTDLANIAADNAGAYFQRFCLAEEVRQRQEEMQQLYQERLANREAVRKQLAALYLERGVDLPAELQDPPKSTETQYLTLPGNFPPVFLEQLHMFTRYYGNCIQQCHTELQGLVQLLYGYGNTCESYINVYWQQPDPKQGVVDAFIAEFNQMQPALRRDIQGKEELHLRAEQLTEQLFTIVERRKDECVQIIEALHHRGTLTDSWSDAVRAIGLALVQGEVERFFTARNLALLYFSALKNEPCVVEDELLELVPQLKLMTQEVAVDPKAAKEKKAPPPKKGGKATDDAAEKAAEDIFTPAVDRALQVMRSALDRLQASQTSGAPKAKADKKGAAEAVAVAEGPTPQGLAAPIVAEELEAAKVRIQCIANFIRDVLVVGLRRVESVRSKLLQNMRKKQITQSSAVNSAMFEIRCAIEEERPVLFQLHLGSETFAIDTSKPLAAMQADAVCLSGVPFAGLAAPPAQETFVLTSLTKSRVMELIRDFRILAPKYTLHKDDFLWLVRSSDYADASPKAQPLPPDVIFDRFDISGCGAIDWRDFLTHLLLWCEPISTDATLFEANNSLGIEGPSLTQLFDMRADIGSEPLSREEFLDTPLFFDGEMPEERLMAYLELLWEIFHAEDGKIEPDVMITFMCPDTQPLRGIQKAFVVAATPGDESCAATPENLDTVFHLNSTCPRNMLMYDAHSADTFRSLLPEGSETLVFGDACKSHVGRVLFNSTKTFFRKSFV